MLVVVAVTGGWRIACCVCLTNAAAEAVGEHGCCCMGGAARRLLVGMASCRETQLARGEFCWLLAASKPGRGLLALLCTTLLCTSCSPLLLLTARLHCSDVLDYAALLCAALHCAAALHLLAIQRVALGWVLQASGQEGQSHMTHDMSGLLLFWPKFS